MHCETHGKALGDGADLALVHGWGIDQSAWQPVASALARTFRVHLVGLPGYGGAAPAAGGFAPTAQRLVAALPAGVILCAWSLGAMLAQHAARLAPERVSRLILVASTPSFTQRADWPHGQPPALLESFATAVGLDPDAARQRFIALLNQGDGAARRCTRTLARLAVAASAQPDRATLERGLAWLRDIDLRAEAPAIATPTLLIHGGRDALIVPAAAQWLAQRLPRGRLEIMAEAAHAPFVSDPAHFVHLINDYCHAPAAA